ncbi:PIN domain-containing protein [Candidatus Parabeggiatoa sp. HSG14]|uniref:PIN domain-containing protein n=1 Tax=Candidatus Parabeggiatoa sp. HSG14 TaxID=3055593 RepID=UPI0025A6D8C5|nr:PIN domain-containing protein [Thiotrichales bacterium HSG14]
MIENSEGRLLDTNVCIIYMNARAKAEEKRTPKQQQIIERFESIKGNAILCMSEATLGELLFGAEKSQNQTKNLKRIQILKNVVSPLLVDQEVWEVFGKIKAELQKLGKPVDDMDILIAATAKKYELVLVTGDADMDNLDFLQSILIKRENWIKTKISD